MEYAAETPDCVLCQARLETPILREARFWRTAINRNQNRLGKVMVILRRHEEAVSSLAPEEWSELLTEVQWITQRLSAAFAPDHFNYAFLQNFDRHVHLHVMPRYVGVRSFAGIQFSDPDYPDRYQGSAADENVVGADVLTAIASALIVPAPESPAVGR